MTPEMLEILDGYLLSDGNISRYKCLNIHQKYKEFAQYIADFFKAYFDSGKAIVKYYKVADSRMKSGYTEGHLARTLSHPDLFEQYNRWYPNSKKIIPEDVAITPTSALILHLGDGNLDKTGRGRPRVTFATMSFSKDDIQNILIPKLKKAIESDEVYSRKNGVVALSTEATKKFFEYVGYKSPVSCYEYKFLSKAQIQEYQERFDTRHTRRRVVDYEKMISLHSDGMSLPDIARALKCEYRTVWAAAKGLKLIFDRPSRSEAAKLGRINRKKSS